MYYMYYVILYVCTKESRVRTDRERKESKKIFVYTVIEIGTIFILLKRYLNYVNS